MMVLRILFKIFN